MGQQQILFLILGLCVVGIAISVGVINSQTSSVGDHRDAILNDLRVLAINAQEFYSRPEEQGGGGNSFIGLTSNRAGIEKLTRQWYTNSAEYSIARSGNTRYVQIMAVGSSPGTDPRHPIKVLMTVWAKSTSTQVLN